MRAALGGDLPDFVGEQAEDVEHGAEAFAFLLRDPHHGT